MIFQKLFNKYDYSFRMTQAKLQFLSAAPRYLLEAIGITVFSILMYYQLGTGLYDVAVEKVITDREMICVKQK